MTWPKAALAEVATIVSGATPNTGVAQFWDGGIPWATPRDLSELDKATIARTPRTISESGLRSCAATVLPAGSVLFSSRAPIGHVAINTVPMATNQGFKSFVPKPGKLDAVYLYHWLRAHRPQLEALGNGATFKEVSKAVVSRVEIPLPPIEEQRRISSILDHVDSLQRQCRLALRNLTTLSQVVFPSELTASWPRLALRDACLNDGDYGANVPSTEMAPGRPRYIRITDIDEHGGLNRDERAPAGRAADWERYVVQPGDVLFARSGATVGKTYLQPEHGPDAVFAGYLIRFQTNPEVLDPVYLAGYTHTSEYRSWVAARQNVVAQPNINAKQYGNELLVPIPPLGIQHDYRRLVEAIEGRRVVMRQREALLARLSDSLRARAFSGRL